MRTQLQLYEINNLFFADDIWFKKTLRDLVEKHFCTASPDWLDSHAASKQMRAIFEENTRYDYEVCPITFIKNYS